MISIIKGLNKVLNKKQKLYLTFIYLAAFLMSALDTIGVGSLVGFIAIISNPDLIIEKIPFDSIRLFLVELDNKTIMVYSSILIVLIFFIKNLIFIFVYYAESQIQKNLNVDLSKRVFSSFLKTLKVNFSNKFKILNHKNMLKVSLKVKIQIQIQKNI